MIISKDWKIESDDLNVTILKRKHIAEKEGIPAHDNWYPKGYFASPKNALKWLVNHKVTGTGMGDLETVVKAIDELHATIDSLAINR